MLGGAVPYLGCTEFAGAAPESGWPLSRNGNARIHSRKRCHARGYAAHSVRVGTRSDRQLTLISCFSAVKSKIVLVRYAAEDATAAPFIPMRGIRKRSSAVVTASAAIEKRELYPL